MVERDNAKTIMPRDPSEANKWELTLKQKSKTYNQKKTKECERKPE